MHDALVLSGFETSAKQPDSLLDAWRLPHLLVGFGAGRGNGQSEPNYMSLCLRTVFMFMFSRVYAYVFSICIHILTYSRSHVVEYSHIRGCVY